MGFLMGSLQVFKIRTGPAWVVSTFKRIRIDSDTEDDRSKRNRSKRKIVID